MPATYTENGNTPNDSQLVFPYTFPALQTEDVRVAINGKSQLTTKYTVDNTSNPTTITFNNTDIDTTVQESTGAPKTGVTVRVYRQTIVGKDTGDEDPKAVYAAGSSVRAIDLNDNQRQDLYGIHEIQEQPILYNQIQYGLIDSNHIKDGSIVDADISPTAEIQVSKLKNGTARQVLQTAANGTDVEWTDSVSLSGTLGVTSNTTVGGTLGVTSNTTVGGTLGVTGESTLASATVSDLTSGRIVFTSTGGALVDSADLTFDTTGDGHLKVGVDGGYGTITCATINATYWNGENSDAYWRVNRNSIDHYGKDTGVAVLGTYVPAIRIRKDSGNLSSAHTFSIAKDYTFEVGQHYNEGLAGGVWGTIHYAPVFSAKQLIEQTRVTNTSSNNPGQSSSDYSVFTGSQGCEDEQGYISIGDTGGGYRLKGTTIALGGFTKFDARRNGVYTANNNPNDPDSYQPVLMLSGQKGAMFVHPDNTSHMETTGGTSSTGLSYLAYGAGGHGVQNLGDSYNYGGDGYRDPDECIDLLEAAADLQIIVGGVRAKNRIEIGSASVTGTLAISGTNVTSTATELNNLDGYTGNTSELNILDGVTATTAELNIVDGMTKATSLTVNSDTEYPTSKAVADHITTVIAPLGGLEVIATEVLFPNTQPDSGVVISISDAGGVAFNGSGVSTTATTVGGSTVTINGAPSSLYSETLVAGVGLMVSSTGSSQTYNYHKILGKEDDIKQLSDDINDFNARYRIESSAPSSNNDDGDLYYDTTLKKMKVYNAVTSQWDDVAQSSSSYIVTLSEAFNGTLQDFTMSTAATDAQSTLVSINGVLQKPNAGTSAPSEGFAISGNTLKLAAAPPTGSDYFVVVLGDTVSIGTPSDNTVTSAKIVDGSIVNGDISSSAAIAGSKIAPDFGSQDPTTTGKLITNSSSSGDYIRLYAASGTGKWDIYGNGANLRISDNDSAGKVQIDRAVLLPDDVKLEFGDITTPDLEIYHNGSNSYIDNNTGSLVIRTNVAADVGGDIFIKPHDDEVGITVVHDAEVGLYYAGAGPKLKTSSTGVQVTGDIILTGSGTSDTNSLDISYDATSGVASINADSSGGNTSLSFGTSNGGTLDDNQLYINNTGDVGINNNSPDCRLSVTDYDNYVAEFESTNGNVLGSVLTLYGNSPSPVDFDLAGILRFSGQNSADEKLSYSQIRCCITDVTDGTEDSELHLWNRKAGTNANRVKINDNIEILDGNLILADTHGINFSASESSNTTDSSILSDYEEGTYEPTFTCQNSGSFTPQTHVKLDYIKIGKLCHIQGYINMNGSSGTISGPLRMSLPFTVDNAAHYDTSNISVSMRGHGDTLPGISGAADQGQSFMEFISVAADGSNEWINGPTLNTTWNVRIGGSYVTAA